MQLLTATIRAAGFTAMVDAFAQDGGQMWFLSLLGNQQSVRALWARLLKGETAYLSEDELGAGSSCWLAGEAWGTWRFYSARLPSGAAYHGLLVPELAAYPPLAGCASGKVCACQFPCSRKETFCATAHHPSRRLHCRCGRFVSLRSGACYE